MNHKVTDLSSPVTQCLVTLKAHALIMFDNPDYLWFQLTTLDAAVILWLVVVFTTTSHLLIITK